MNASPVAEATCRVTREAITLWILGLMLDEVFWQTTLHTVLRGHLVSAAILAAILGVLLVMGDRPSERLGAAALLVSTTLGLVAFNMSDRLLAMSSEPWTPFEAQRLGALTIALLAPPRAWLGVTCIAGITIVPLVEWATWSLVWRARLPVAAPWMVVAYGLFALVVYTHQLRRQALERRMALAQAEAAALLSVRDLANTPLQTIELTVALMRKQQTFDASQLIRLSRAAERLVAIGHALETRHVDYRLSRKPVRARPTRVAHRATSFHSGPNRGPK